MGKATRSLVQQSSARLYWCRRAGLILIVSCSPVGARVAGRAAAQPAAALQAARPRRGGPEKMMDAGQMLDGGEHVELDPYLGTNLPMYPALPLPRRLSSYDPEWEEDPEFAHASRREAAAAHTSKKLPSPAVLRDILRDLNDEQAREEQFFREQQSVQGAISEELAAAAQMQAQKQQGGGGGGERNVAKVTGISFEEERAYASAPRQHHGKASATEFWNGPAGEADLIRATTCNGPKVGLSPVWSLSSDAPADSAALRPQGGDQALYAAPLLQTMRNYEVRAGPLPSPANLQPDAGHTPTASHLDQSFTAARLPPNQEEAFTDGSSRRRTMNLVKMEGEAGRRPRSEWADANWRLSRAGASSSSAGAQGTKPTRVITFRTKKVRSFRACVILRYCAECEEEGSPLSTAVALAAEHVPADSPRAVSGVGHGVGQPRHRVVRYAGNFL